MKLFQKDIWILVLSVILIIMCTTIENSHLALAVSALLGILALFNKKVGLLTLSVFTAFRPFLITMNPGLKLVGDIIIFMLLIRTFFDSRNDIKSIFKFNLFEIAFIAFGLVGTFSALIHGVELKAIITQIRAYYLFYIVFYVVKRMNITKKDTFHFLWLSFLAGIILSVQGIVEKISDRTMLLPKVWEMWNLSPTNRIRVYGLLSGPNELSLYLFICFILAFLLVKLYQGKMRFVFYIGMVLMGTTILLTYSRGTFLCILIFAIVYFIIKRPGLGKVVPIIVIAALSGAMFFGVTKAENFYYAHYLKNMKQGPGDQLKGNDSGLDRFSGAFSDQSLEQSNSAGRIYYVKKAAEVFKDYPIIGSGFATFGGAGTLKYSSPIYKHYHIRYNFYSDNQYILALVETGIVGILLLAVMVLSLGKFTWQRRKDYFYSPMLVYFWIGIVFGGLVYNILENDSFMLNYFLLLGFAFGNKIRGFHELD